MTAPSTSPADAPHPSEPDAQRGAIRRFRDPAYRPLAATLAEVREGIDTLDEQLIALLAQRAMYVKDATRFKRDPHQVAAPARQAEVFARVRKLAELHQAGFAPLPDVVEATWRAMVAAFIATEQVFFNETELIDPQT